MSMLQKIALKLKDKGIVERSAEKLGWKVLGQGSYNVGYGNNVEGLGLEMPNGKVAVVTDDGELACLDDYMTSETVNSMKARYGAEKAKTDARKAGYRVTEKVVNGKIKIIATEA